MGQDVAPGPNTGKGRSSYREPYSVYAERFGSSDRTIKRWVKDGVDAGDPCPLDDARELRSWWTRRMKQRVPDEIVAAAAALEPLLEFPVHVPKPVPAPGEPPAEKPAPLPTRAPASALVDIDEADLGITASLRRAQQREIQAQHGWENAATEEERAFYERRLEKATESVRRLSKDAFAEQVSFRAYIPRGPAEQQLTEFSMDLLNRVRGLSEEMARALGIPVTAEMDRRWNETIDALCETLQVEVFAEEANAESEDG